MKVNYQERIEASPQELKIISARQRTVTERQIGKALYLLKSRLSATITEVAELWRVHRTTVLAMVKAI